MSNYESEMSFDIYSREPKKDSGTSIAVKMTLPLTGMPVVGLTSVNIAGSNPSKANACISLIKPIKHVKLHAVMPSSPQT